jgi:hypothetical protein
MCFCIYISQYFQLIKNKNKKSIPYTEILVLPCISRSALSARLQPSIYFN